MANVRFNLKREVQSMGAMMVLILALTLTCVGCGSATRVMVMQNPGTVQVGECKVDPWGDIRRDKQSRIVGVPTRALASGLLATATSRSPKLS
jgi:hypothetical protein